MNKGFAYERELVHELERRGFASLRAPASGSRTKLDRPDIIAGRHGFHLVIEVKTTSANVLYIRKESIMSLLRFAERFGAQPFVAVKFKGKRKGWLLTTPSQLRPTAKGYVLAYEEALRISKKLDALGTASITDY